jgi:DNA mismatch repair protein MutL
MVENLFFNVPARRKFLKSNSTELNNIIAAFERIVLVYPNISFTLHSNGSELLNLKAGNLRQRIMDVFGKRVNQDLLPVKVDTTMCRISGFVGKPESARKKGALQFFFVNGRYMKHPYFHKAVQNAFERLVPTGEQVPYFIYFEVPPQDIDVNIHPVKTEIKFENEQAIWQILTACVKEAVGLFNDVPSISFDEHGRPDIPVFSPTDHPTVPKTSYDPQYNPFKPTSHASSKSVPSQWETLYEGLNAGNEPSDLFVEPSDEARGEDIIAEKSPTHYQYKGRYIMTAVKSGLMIIDQHRAHVRILYEQYLEQQRKKQWTSQKILFTEMVRFSPSERVLMEKIEPVLTDMGFELSDLGQGNYAVNAIPAGLEGVDAVALVKDMVASAVESGTDAREELDKSMALTLARNAAIPYGQVLGNEEMENIVNSLFACSNANYTPNGKLVLAILKQDEIEQLLR